MTCLNVNDIVCSKAPPEAVLEWDSEAVNVSLVSIFVYNMIDSPHM